MREKGLRGLSRRELLELLISQGREMDALRDELEQAKAELADRRIHVERSGSIAEAALRLNGVFEAAQAAADQYLDNIRLREATGDAPGQPDGTPTTDTGRPA